MVEQMGQRPNTLRYIGIAMSGQQSGDNAGADSDWNRYVRQHADEMAQNAGPYSDFGPLPHQVWQRVEAQAKDPRNYDNEYAAGWGDGHDIEDIERAARELGINALRYSAERAILQPEPDGDLDPRAVRLYDRRIEAIRANGMEPFETLEHFAVPAYFQESGGWLSHGSINSYLQFVEKRVRQLDGSVKNFLTMNEPWVNIYQRYFSGDWPPNKKNRLDLALRARRHRIEAHKRAYDKIKEIDPEAQVSAAIDLFDIEPKNDSVKDRLGVKVFDAITNKMFLPAMAGHMDFIGINYYSYNVRTGLNPTTGNFQNEEGPRSDTGVHLHPESLYKVLMKASRFGKPLMVTEVGLADAESRFSEWYVKETFMQTMKAKRDGADIQGLFWWSLVDNSEGQMGTWPKYGLYGVDLHTQERSKRPAAREFAHNVNLYKAT